MGVYKAYSNHCAIPHKLPMCLMEWQFALHAHALDADKSALKYVSFATIDQLIAPLLTSPRWGEKPIQHLWGSEPAPTRTTPPFGSQCPH